MTNVIDAAYNIYKERGNKVKDQVRKGTEICWSMGLAGINILVTWAMTTTLMIPERRSLRFLSGSTLTQNNEFLLIGVLPSLLCHLAGCAFLVLHYKAFHPWRNLFTSQRKQETRTGLKEETPFWEEVRTSQIKTYSMFLKVGEVE